MAMTATLQQAATATFSGGGTPFVLTVLNSGGAQVNVNSIQPFVTNASGAPLNSCPFNIGIVTAPGSAPSVPVAGGTQFSVPVPAGGSTVFTFNIQFFAPAIAPSGFATATPSFLVSANVQTSDGSVFVPPPLTVALNQPTWGVPGSPPNVVPVTGQLMFSAPASSALAL